MILCRKSSKENALFLHFLNDTNKKWQKWIKLGKTRNYKLKFIYNFPLVKKQKIRYNNIPEKIKGDQKC